MKDPVKDPMPLGEPIPEPNGDVVAMPKGTVDENGADKGRPSQRDKLIACASAADLWHDADGTGYATLTVDNHAEHYRMRSKGFRDWLSYRFYQDHKGAPSSQATQDALAALEAKARFEGEQHTPAVRIAHHGGNIYLDLADDDWQAIEITPHGWSVVSCRPVKIIASAQDTYINSMLDVLSPGDEPKS